MIKRPKFNIKSNNEYFLKYKGKNNFHKFELLV